jgi:hypothetical protein
MSLRQRRRLAARIGAQGSDSIEELPAMPQRGNAELLQVLSRQAGKNRFVDLILAEDSLVFPKAKAPQPNHDVHYGAPSSGLPHIIVRSGDSVQEVPKWAIFSVNQCRC